MYLGDYNGYFLITNAALSSDHIALLEKLRSDKKYNLYWWAKEGIDGRLKTNIDLQHEYEDFVSYVNLKARASRVLKRAQLYEALGTCPQCNLELTSDAQQS